MDLDHLDLPSPLHISSPITIFFTGEERVESRMSEIILNSLNTSDVYKPVLDQRVLT